MKTGSFWIVHSYYRNRQAFDDYDQALACANKAKERCQNLRNPSYADEVHITEHAYPEPPAVTGYPPEEAAAIQSQIVESLTDQIKTGGWVSCRWSDRMVTRGRAPRVFEGTDVPFFRALTVAQNLKIGPGLASRLQRADEATRDHIKESVLALFEGEEREDVEWHLYKSRYAPLVDTRQTFAVFGDYAYELLRFDRAGENGTEFEYRPVILDGRMFRMDPEEGSGGMLYLMRCLKRKGVPQAGKWLTTYLSGGWIYTRELELSNEEIMQNIADEVDAGLTPLTGGMPGWA